MSSFVTTFPLDRAAAFREELEAQGYAISQPDYTLFSAKKSGVNCTLYASGKLVVQGKASREFIEFELEAKWLTHFPFTCRENAPEVTAAPTDQAAWVPHIGSDEAGKGDLFGPLCVAAVYVDESHVARLRQLKVRDSKEIQAKEIYRIATAISLELPHAVVKIFPERYNELYPKFQNLNLLLAWAHATALEKVWKLSNCNQAVVDQFAKGQLVQRYLGRKEVPLQIDERVRAESDLAVAAASILARAAFLKGMEELSREVGHLLPRGAGAPARSMLRTLLTGSAVEQLHKCVKMHFKTVAEESQHLRPKCS